MTVFVPAYDVEAPRCLPACRKIVELHRRFDAPATFFIVGKILEANPVEYRELLDNSAFYTGPAGGTAGPGARGAEACIWGVSNFVDIRDTIIGIVRGRPLFGMPRAAEPDISSEILEELRKIRKAVEK